MGKHMRCVLCFLQPLVFPLCLQGVWEKDEVRKMDSFLAFEEILKRAAELKVDMVLLGGDLFHENKPSRNTVVKAIELMKKYCLNDKPVQFQILSDQASAFVAGWVQVVWLTGMD
jgi:double-strand break repair protein MRE11